MKRKRSKPKIDRTMPMVHTNAAAIDFGATMHMAAVRADRTPEPVRSFGTFRFLGIVKALYISFLLTRRLRPISRGPFAAHRRAFLTCSATVRINAS
jgi:hypothetical protein